MIEANITEIFREILEERRRQDKKWGEQNHSLIGNYTNSLSGLKEQYPSGRILEKTLEHYRKRNKKNDRGWFDILIEEVCEAFVETDIKKMRKEIIQVAAVVVAIIECLDRLKGAPK